ncbi:MAG: aminotransferase class IV [Clostridia bacterium]
MNKYFILNGEVKLVDEYNLEAIEKQEGVYEVIRVVEKTPLFAREHVKRLYKSANLIDLEVNMTEKEILQNICKLSTINNIEEKNIKLLFTKKGDSYFFFIKSFYPDEKMVNEGVDTITYKVSRENPNVKYHNTELRASINKKLKEANAYEALLVDDENRVVEGSRSNIFFIKANTLFTAPSSAVLMGITREKVLEICNDLKIDVVEKDIFLSELEDFEGVFMTSTSNNVLPIKSIEDIDYSNFNGKLKKIMTEFSKKMTEDLTEMECICEKIVKE